MSSVFLGFVAVMSAAAGGAAMNLASERSRILGKEAELSLGGKLKLTPEEERVNEIIMKYKLEEVDKGFLHPESFNFSHHYFSYKDKIDSSKLYQVLQRMPKGAALHVHDTALLGPDYLLQVTYLDNLYICFDGDDVNFRFSNSTPESKGACKWQLARDARASSGNPKKFDSELRKHFTCVIDDPERVDTNVNALWIRFLKVFATITPMLTYRPVWEQYFYDALAAFRDDNISYVEVRSTLPLLYDLDGNEYDVLETARTYKRAHDRFLADNPDFLGAKIIYAPQRLVNTSTVEDYINDARKIKADLGAFMAGFDLVGQEDLGRPLVDFLPILAAAKNDLDYFFHAGETNWWGFATDGNLVDAILLGTKRLGHAYALLKHPVLTEMVKERRIGIEVNVISNQVLGLVCDMRNHPLAQFLAQDLPVVLSSDDPGLWEAPPISHDFYVALVGVANKHSGLRVLKQLALNSLHFSALDHRGTERALDIFEERWSKFIKEVIEEFEE